MFGLLFAAGESRAQTRPGTSISNTAYAAYSLAGAIDTVRSPSNVVTIITKGGRTPAILEFLRHAPGAAGAEFVRVNTADSLLSLPLIPATTFQLGEVVYLRLTDLDQNLDHGQPEIVAVELTLAPNGDQELFLLHETGPSTGIFTRAAASRAALNGTPGNGRLDARNATEIHGRYVDRVDPTDVAVDAAVFVGEAPRLHLDKSVSNTRASIGDLVEYTLRLDNPSGEDVPEAETARGVTIVDQLPPGFRYREGSARQGALVVDPAVSPDGSRLTFHVGDMDPGDDVVFQYLVDVAAGARAGEAINTAEAATNTGAVSNTAQASILVLDDFFRRGFIAGRVTVGACDSTVAGTGPGVFGVRLVLEDGTWTTTDENGRYHFEGVPAGMHVIAIDGESVPFELEPADCPDTHRFARSRDSQFVPLEEGTLWRADFRLTPRDPGMIHASPDSTLEGEEAPDAPTTAEATDAPAGPPIVTDAFTETLAPGAAWVWPPERYGPSIPGLTVIVKHDATVTPELWCNGRAVPKLNLSETRRNAAGTLAVTTWTGVDIQEGSNRLEARMLSADGGAVVLVREVHYAGSPVDVVIVPSLSHLVADGLTPPVVAVRLVDRDGHPARERVVGSFHVDPPYGSLLERDARHDNPLATLNAPQYQVGADGVALIELEPTPRTGEVVIRFPLDGHPREVRAWLEPTDRGWMLVGLADGTVAHRTVSDHMEAPTGDEDDYDTDGRIAFYARGRVKGSWLLTLAVDSRGGNPGPSGDLDRVIDPDSYYTLYGDATTQDYDAPSSRKVYVRLERREFYALFGDTDAGLTRTELNRYTRRVNGFKTEYRGRNAGWTAFAAQSESRFVRREIPGNGTSGLYDLQHPEMVVNSETIVLETRDRFRSEFILRSRTLHRHVDYDIDYAAGTLWFREPVFSQDADFNPNWIVAVFESRDPESNRMEAGGRAAVYVDGDRFEAGATGVYDEDGTSPGRLAGGDVRYRLDPVTTLRGEGAWSEDGDGREGNAWLAEIERRGSRVDGMAWYRRQDTGFGLDQQNRGEQGIEKYGADVTWHATRADRARAQAFRQFNLASGARRDVGELALVHDAARIDLRAGIRHAVDRFAERADAVSDQLTAGGDWRVWNGRLSLKADHAQSIGGRNNNVDYPTRTLLGLDWRMVRQVSLVASQEFTNGPTVDTRSARVGLVARPWTGGELATSIGRRTGESGERLFANLGLHQTWRVSERWFLDAGLDQSKTIGSYDSVRVNPGVPPASGGTADLLAVSLGAARHGDAWQWNGRVEYLDAPGETRWSFVPSLFVQPRQAFGAALGGRIFLTDGPVDRTRADIRASLALRPDNSPWIVANRLDWVVLDEQGPSTSNEEWRVIDNLHVNRRFGRAFQATLQYGGKYIDRSLLGSSWNGYTDLWGAEARHDIAAHFDLGLSGGLRHSWTVGTSDWYAGASAGWVMARGLWLQGGYNVTGFRDEDFSEAAVTVKGPFLRLSARFDTDALSRLGFGDHAAGKDDR
ncbi:MAG TPA: DUF11 domain-containing protein [Candidatus Eisenbacteria bacterium]